MIAYKSNMNTFFLLIFSFLFLGLGISSMWFDMLIIYKVLALLFTSLISAVLFYTFIYYIRAPKEAFVISDGKITLYLKKSIETYELKDIKEISFNYNVPYMCIAFTFSIIMNTGKEISVGCFVSKQVKIFKMMKQILTENNIRITKDYCFWRA